MTDGDGTREKLGVAERFLFDAGDTFLPSHIIRHEDRPRWEATALFLVERYNAHGVDALSLGDRDLGLGRAQLDGLVKAARFPVLAANVLDIKTNQSAFKAFAIVERAGVKVGVIGLLSNKKAMALTESLTADGLRVVPPDEAMRMLASEMAAAGADFWIVLSQLSPIEETQLSEAFPQIRAFLGGDGMAAPHDPLPVGSAWSFGGGQKGKQVSAAIIDFQAAGGPEVPWILGDPKAIAKRDLSAANARIKQLESQLEKLGPAPEPGTELNAAPTPQPGQPGQPSQRATEIRRKQLESQLVNARTQQQAAQVALEAAEKAGDGPGNTMQLSVYAMGRDMVDKQEDADAVSAFRLKWPAPPGH